MSMLHSLVAERSQREIWWIYGARNPERLEHASRELGTLSSAAFDATNFDQLNKFFEGTSRDGANVGCFLGAALVWLHYLPHWKETSDSSAKLAVFCTGPAIRSVGANLISEIVGTFVLVFIAGTIFAKALSQNAPSAGLGPYLACGSSYCR
jgi:hypothetical protein